MIEQCEHTKANACKAALAERMHKNSLCPGNYHIHYGYGWFQLTYGPDEPGSPFQDMKLTARAEELLALHKETGKPTIGFSTVWNTFVVMGR